MVLVPPTGAERASAIVAGIVLALSVLGVFAVLILTDDDVSASPSPVTGQDPSVLGDGGSGDRQQGSGSGTTRATPAAAIPLPPGTRPFDYDLASPGEKTYIVRGRVPQIKAFFDQRLPGVGLEWRDPQTTTISSTGRIVGWHGPLVSGEDYVGSLSIDEDGFYTGRRNVVSIRVTKS